MTGYLGVDPGKTTGWAYFDENGKFIAFGQAEYMEFMAKLYAWPESMPVKTIVIEDYKLFSHKAKQQSGSRMEASQVIGAVAAWGQASGALLVKQPASVKHIAEKFSQVRPPSNHALSHWVDAFNHAVYYLVQQGIRPTALQQGSPQ